MENCVEKCAAGVAKVVGGGSGRSNGGRQCWEMRAKSFTQGEGELGGGIVNKRVCNLTVTVYFGQEVGICGSDTWDT